MLNEFLEEESTFKYCFRRCVVKSYLFRKWGHVHAFKRKHKALPQHVKLAKSASDTKFNYFTSEANSCHSVLNMWPGLEWLQNSKLFQVLTNRVTLKDLKHSRPCVIIIWMHLDHLIRLTQIVVLASVYQIDRLVVILCHLWQILLHLTFGTY